MTEGEDGLGVVARIPALFDTREALTIERVGGGFLVTCGEQRQVATTKRQLLAILRELL